MNTQGEIEAALCVNINKFAQEYMGRGSANVNSYLVDDFLVVRLRNVLTEPEKQLAKVLPASQGRDLLKQVRTQLVELGMPIFKKVIKEISGVDLVSLHHDISTTNGEEFVIFTLSERPTMRGKK